MRARTLYDVARTRPHPFARLVCFYSIFYNFVVAIFTTLFEYSKQIDFPKYKRISKATLVKQLPLSFYHVPFSGLRVGSVSRGVCVPFGAAIH